MPTSLTPGPATKRRRTDSSSSLSSPLSLLPSHSSYSSHVHLPPPTRSEIWFDDGSIVLQAENTQFLVHRSMLARHSEVFKDLFMVPQPPAGSEPTVEGRPVVCLVGDSKEDVRNMLVALYDKTYTTRDALPFPLLASMLRMGRKYDIPQLRSEALLRLQKEFPTDLEEWQALPPEYTQIVEQKGVLFDIVNLALQEDVRTVLPSAYYLCVQDLPDLLHGIPRADGTTAQLPTSVQRLCLLARETLLKSQAEHTFSWVHALGDEVEDCHRPFECAKVAVGLMRDLWVPLPEVSRTLEK